MVKNKIHLIRLIRVIRVTHTGPRRIAGEPLFLTILNPRLQ
jgi:hypothetical protein